MLKHRRTLTRVLVVGFLVIALMVLFGLGWYLAVTLLPIKPETATRSQLVQWLVLRNFAAEPLVVQDALVDRFDAEFGMSSGRMLPSAFSATTQSIIRSVTGKRVAADNAIQKAGCKTNSDRNTKLLVRRLIERSRLAYTCAPRDQRNAVVQHIAAQLEWWEQFQVAYCNAIGVVPPTQADLMEDFEQIFRDIIAGVPETDHAAIKQYKMILMAVLVLRHIKRPVPHQSANKFHE